MSNIQFWQIMWRSWVWTFYGTRAQVKSVKWDRETLGSFPFFIFIIRESICRLFAVFYTAPCVICIRPNKTNDCKTAACFAMILSTVPYTMIQRCDKNMQSHSRNHLSFILSNRILLIITIGIFSAIDCLILQIFTVHTASTTLSNLIFDIPCTSSIHCNHCIRTTQWIILMNYRFSSILWWLRASVRGFGSMHAFHRQNATLMWRLRLTNGTTEWCDAYRNLVVRSMTTIYIAYDARVAIALSLCRPSASAQPKSAALFETVW